MIRLTRQVRWPNLNKKVSDKPGTVQLSKAWIDAVIDNLAPNDPTRQILINADKAGKLKTAVTGVDRATGQAVIIPVNVPAKSKSTVKK